ncbi:MAG: hypothetical protein ACRYHA_08455 [Janthinobacterium lividum]
MSNKSATAARRTLRLALATAFAIVIASPTAAADIADAGDATAAGETVDAFARRQLEEQTRGASAPGSGLELMFTQAEGTARSAYLLVDGRYGKDVRRGDIVKGWTIRAIESDAVEIGKDGRREKLLLASEVRPDQATASTGRAENR